MRRPTRYALLALILAVILAGTAVLAWLCWTTAGAGWLLESVSRHTTLKISARKVEGRLLDHLRLTGVQIRQPLRVTEVESLDLSWHALSLLYGAVDVQKLSLAGVRVLDNAPPSSKAPELTWPRLTGIPARLTGHVNQLRIDRLTYRRPDERPLDVPSFSATLTWRKGILSLGGLDVVTPAGRVTGTAMAGFLRPALGLDLNIAPPRPLAGITRISLHTRLLPGHAPEQLAGNVKLSGTTTAGQRLEIGGEVGMTRTSFNLRSLLLTGPNQRGTVRVEGSIRLTAGEPAMSLRVRADDLRVAPKLMVPAAISGEVVFEGGPSDYRGSFALANRGKGWQSARASGHYHGDRHGVRLSDVSGTLLEGNVRGEMEGGWEGGLSLRGTIRARGLNPAMIAPRWSGVVNADLSGTVQRPLHAPLHWKLSAELPESSLHGHPLTGELRAEGAGANLRIGRLALHGRGFDIDARGMLAKRLSLAARVRDLSRLIPGTAGELGADGWVRWNRGRLTGDLSGSGRNLQAYGIRMAAANLTARLGEGAGYHPLHVTATLRRARYGRFQADSAALRADGTLADHSLDATLISSASEARMGVTGSYNQGAWHGRIVRLSGHDAVGPWHLESPTPLAISPGSIFVAPLVVTGRGAERISLAAELTHRPLNGTMRMQWSNVNLARADQWLAGVRLTGAGSGAIRLDLGPEDRVVASVSAETGGTVTVDQHTVTVQRALLTLDGNERGLHAAMELRLPGGLLKCEFSSTAPLRLDLPGTGTLAVEWSGFDLALLRPWLPVGLNLEGRLAGAATGRLLPGGGFDLRGKSAVALGKLRLERAKEVLDLGLDSADVSWSWRGSPGDSSAPLTVRGRILASGTVTANGQRITVHRVAVSLDGDEQGMRAGMELSLADGGTLKASLSSRRPAGLPLTGEGDVTMEWADIDLALLGPWLPRTLSLEGRLGGRATGRLLPGRRIELDGSSTLSPTTVRVRDAGGEVNGTLRGATLSWSWRGDTLVGALSLTMTGDGRVRGSFRLPLPARFPVAIDPGGEVRAALNGTFQEQGLLSALFPGFVRETSAAVDAGLLVEGIWREPRFSGNLRLAKGSAYLPAAGIHVTDAGLDAHLENDLVRINMFRALSGPGHIEGTALIRLKGWRAFSYSGKITGERLQIVYLPEVQCLVTPQLTFEGSRERLAVRGEIRVPELLVNGPPVRGVVAPSSDVIMVGAHPPGARAAPLAMDIRVRVVLGDRVLVKMEGIDAQLGGSMDLKAPNLDTIVSSGEVRVVKGRYKAYGIDLEIVRGRLFYAGDPIGSPALDILALRTVGDVQAGVTVGGTPRAPLVKLYSKPAMPDVDILAYIVLGHPLGTGGEQAGLLAQAAGFLLSSSQSVNLKDQIKNRLGLSTLEIGAVGTTPEHMGYAAIPVTPPGTAPTQAALGVSQTMLTVGKYLTPRLYLSFGRSVFTGGNLVRLRYDISRRWEAETQTGAESGADIYYKIDFR